MSARCPDKCAKRLVAAMAFFAFFHRFVAEIAVIADPVILGFLESSGEAFLHRVPPEPWSFPPIAQEDRDCMQELISGSAESIFFCNCKASISDIFTYWSPPGARFNRKSMAP